MRFFIVDLLPQNTPGNKPDGLQLAQKELLFPCRILHKLPLSECDELLSWPVGIFGSALAE